MERLTTARVHDLVQLRDGRWAVVRRARESCGIPVGFRGTTRSKRFAGIVDSSEIERVVSPEEAARRRPPREHSVFDALALAMRVAQALEISAGVVGACGYELVTGEPVLHDESDLDLIVRAAFDDPRLAEFAFALRDIHVRIDVEVLLDGECGASLAEVLRGERVLVKTPDGPALW